MDGDPHGPQYLFRDKPAHVVEGRPKHEYGDWDPVQVDAPQPSTTPPQQESKPREYGNWQPEPAT